MSTQTTAARLQLNDDRIRAAEEPIKPASIGRSATVTAGAVTLLRSGSHFTAVVALKNAGAATSDLPLILGYQLKGRTVYLNAGVQSNYFDNHIPAIAGHGSLTWVDAGSARIPQQAKIFATVGAKPSSPVGAHLTLPALTAAPVRATGIGAGTTMVEVHVKNESSVPQYQLPVYAIVTKGSRIVSASAGSITELDGGQKATVKVPVPGGVAGALSLRVEAPATIF